MQLEQTEELENRKEDCDESETVVTLDTVDKEIPITGLGYFLGFKRTPGSFDQLWDWQTLEEVRLKGNSEVELVREIKT